MRDDYKNKMASKIAARYQDLEERIMQISPILEKLGDQGGTLYLENFNTDNITITFEKDVIPDLGT